jgi:arginase family enzyme
MRPCPFVNFFANVKQGEDYHTTRKHALCKVHKTVVLLIAVRSGVNHGTFLHIAHEEGLIRNTSIHAGIRAPILRPKGDLRNDLRCGFEIVKARDIDQIGVRGIIDQLKKRVAGSKVYISVDIDVLDPAFAPGEWFSLPQSYNFSSTACSLRLQYVDC